MDPSVTPSALDNLVTVINSIWTAIVGNGTTSTGLIGTISSNPLLLIAIAGTFAALIIGLTQKLMGTRRRRR